MNKLTECPCCGYPHDDVEAEAMQRVLNKIKADAVRQAAIYFEHILNYESCEVLNEHADKLERGDV